LTQPPANPAVVDFEKALADLEATVDKLEHGELSLEDALRQFEHGIALARQCQAALKLAEQKVEILLQKSADAEPVPFEPDDT
jgi:exodeoxyribonuclease VII small subunit